MKLVRLIYKTHINVGESETMNMLKQLNSIETK